MSEEDRPAKTAEDREHVHELHIFASHLRGQFLNGTAWLEVLLADVIANYFCPDRRRRMFFFSEVANGMRFSGKTALLEKILKFDFPEVHKAHPDLRKKLDSIGEFRNMLAHSHLDTRPETIAAKKRHEVSFIKYRVGELKTVFVTAEQAKSRAQDANKLRRVLLTIQREFRAHNDDKA
jgi:hypothetical protein